VTLILLQSYSLNAEPIAVDPDVAGQSDRAWADVGAISAFASQVQADSTGSVSLLVMLVESLTLVSGCSRLSSYSPPLSLPG
jgi:hypothetical protein